MHELIESNVPGLTATAGSRTPPAGAHPGDADFLMVLETGQQGEKSVGLHLSDLLEFHGLSQPDWERL